MIRALVLRTAGTNCDRETVRALELSGARADLLHVRALGAEPARLDEYAVLVLPGGFSYGDDVAAGRVLGFELRRFLAPALRAFAARGGFVLGVCNGFQVLVDTGLLDGPDASERSMALAGNASARFECRWVTLREERCACPWLEPGALLPVPVAHGEGRFTVRSAGALERLRARGQIALRYVVPEGGPEYPASPSGSVEAIAGVCDPSGRVLGLMPHPERNLTPWHHPCWTRLPPRREGEGLSFYRRLVEAAAASS